MCMYVCVLVHMHIQFMITYNSCLHRYDHLRKEGSDYQAADVDKRAEPWRVEVESAMTAYVQSHYPHGVTTVYGNTADGNITLIACIESHQFQPRNFWYVLWWAVGVDVVSAWTRSEM